MKENATIYDLKRMCNHFICDKCPLYIHSVKTCSVTCKFDNTYKINKIILDWCKEHPTKINIKNIRQNKISLNK